MQVKLLFNSPLWVASKAIRKCWASEDKSDNGGEKDKELIHRIGNKNKHKSTLEHLVYSFDIDGISRACLQELARHRIASYSVKSSRYTLKELKNALDFSKFLVQTPNETLDHMNERQLDKIQDLLLNGVSNDIVKFMLPEAYKTSLVMTINARSLQNFLELRSSKHALWEIRDLAKNMYEAIPEEHKYLFEECMNEQSI
jgi:thymidylate synthase (FAD)